MRAHSTVLAIVLSIFLIRATDPPQHGTNLPGMEGEGEGSRHRLIGRVLGRDGKSEYDRLLEEDFARALVGLYRKRGDGEDGESGQRRNQTTTAATLRNQGSNASADQSGRRDHSEETRRDGHFETVIGDDTNKQQSKQEGLVQKDETPQINQGQSIMSDDSLGAIDVIGDETPFLIIYQDERTPEGPLMIRDVNYAPYRDPSVGNDNFQTVDGGEDFFLLYPNQHQPLIVSQEEDNRLVEKKASTSTATGKDGFDAGQERQHQKKDTVAEISTESESISHTISVDGTKKGDQIPSAIQTTSRHDYSNDLEGVSQFSQTPSSGKFIRRDDNFETTEAEHRQVTMDESPTIQSIRRDDNFQMLELDFGGANKGDNLSPSYLIRRHDNSETVELDHGKTGTSSLSQPIRRHDNFETTDPAFRRAVASEPSPPVQSIRRDDTSETIDTDHGKENIGEILPPNYDPDLHKTPRQLFIRASRRAFHLPVERRYRAPVRFQDERPSEDDLYHYGPSRPRRLRGFREEAGREQPWQGGWSVRRPRVIFPSDLVAFREPQPEEPDWLAADGSLQDLQEADGRDRGEYW